MNPDPYSGKIARRLAFGTVALLTAGILTVAGHVTETALTSQPTTQLRHATNQALRTDNSTPPTTGLTEGGVGGAATGGANTGATVPGELTNVDTALVLSSARVVRENLNDTEGEYVQYTFGHPVNSIRSQNGFVLEGYAIGTQVSSTSAQLVQGDANSVLAQFAPGTDVAHFTLATVDAGVVQDESNKPNIPASVPLGGSSVVSASTDAPQLNGVRVIPTLEQVVYGFNQQVDRHHQPDASGFGFYTLDGREITGSSIVTSVDNTVTVAFGSQVEDGALFFVKRDSMQSARGQQNTPGSVGRPTTAPNLASVSGLIGRTQFDFTFDHPVSDATASDFSVYDGSGNRYKGSGVVQPSSDTIRVAFPQVQKYGHQITLATVDDGAAHSSDGSSTSSTIGARALDAGAVAPGKTSGPDLTSVTLDNSTGQVRFFFDKTIDDNTTYSADKFFVITQSGDMIPARSFVEVNGNSVLVTFDSAVSAAAQSVTVADSAVQDFQGDHNPIGRIVT